MIEWLHIEAAREGLALDDEDFKAIEKLLREAKDELARKRATIPEGTEPRPRGRPLGAVERGVSPLDEPANH